jgi:hypothetical protein
MMAYGTHFNRGGDLSSNLTALGMGLLSNNQPTTLHDMITNSLKSQQQQNVPYMRSSC